MFELCKKKYLSYRWTVLQQFLMPEDFLKVHVVLELLENPLALKIVAKPFNGGYVVCVNLRREEAPVFCGKILFHEGKVNYIPNFIS